MECGDVIGSIHIAFFNFLIFLCIFQPIINSKNLTCEIGSLAYDWKSKISKTGLLKFCFKKQEDLLLPGEVPDSKEASSNSRSLTAAGLVACEAKGSSGNAESEGSTAEKASVSLEQDLRSAAHNVGNSDTSLSSTERAEKRPLRPSGTKSPKKQRKEVKEKCSLTPVNQRKISAFFTK